MQVWVEVPPWLNPLLRRDQLIYTPGPSTEPFLFFPAEWGGREERTIGEAGWKKRKILATNESSEWEKGQKWEERKHKLCWVSSLPSDDSSKLQLGWDEQKPFSPAFAFWSYILTWFMNSLILNMPRSKDICSMTIPQSHKFQRWKGTRRSFN